MTGLLGRDFLAGLFPRTIAVVTVFALLSTADARAEEADAETPQAASAAPDRTPAEVDAFLGRYAPPPVEGPALRLPFTPTGLYLDATYASTDDLSVLPFIAGKAHNVRLAAGGALRWGRFAFTGELVFEQITSIAITEILNSPMNLFPEDAHQTAYALGDLRLGVDWTEHVTPSVVAGLSLRGRFPTHTTAYQFHQQDTSIAVYRFPYFFHIEPTGILGAAVGPFTFVVNQGALVLMGPDGDFGGMHFVEPTIAFWDAHYAASYAILDALAASLEVVTDVQLNHVSDLNFQRLNGVRSVWLAPAVQLHLGDWRVDGVARFGVTRGAELFGVIEYAGTRSFMLRVSRTL